MFCLEHREGTDVNFRRITGKPKGCTRYWDALSKLLTSLTPLYLAIGKSRLHVCTFCIVIILLVVASSFIVYPSGAFTVV